MQSQDVQDLLDDPCEALYRLISFAARDLRRSLQDDFRSWGLTGAQFGVLLGASAGGNIGDIADQLLTDATSVGRMVERMEDAGLVERFRELPDRRVVWVRLLPAGNELLQAMLPLHVERTRQLLGFLGKERQQLFVDLLTDVRDHVATDGSSVTPSR